VDGKVLKPTGKVPLGLIFDTNRGMLQSGAQRVLVKEKDLKPMKVISTSKTNFMKPTEAFRYLFDSCCNLKFYECCQ
jgi:hypothetical protein